MLTLENLMDKIDECLEDGKQIGIACDKMLAIVLIDYIDCFELKCKHNILAMPSIGHRKLDINYVIIINCKNGEFEYYVDFYELNEQLPNVFDEFIWIGERFKGFNGRYISAMSYVYSNKDITFTKEEIDDILNDEYEYNRESVKSNNVDKSTIKVNPTITPTAKCVECCVECTDKECEYQGNINDCDCNKCYLKKRYEEDRNSYDDDFTCECEEDCDCESECEECKCECKYEDNEYNETEFIKHSVKTILSTGGCEDCITNIINDMVRLFKNIGWNDHKEYIDKCNDMR